MLVLRMQRTGRKNDATYRIVVTEKSAPMKSGEKEILGHYLPMRKPPVFESNTERISFWIKNGAKPSNTLARQLAKAGMKDMEKYFETYTKKRSKNAPPEEPSSPTAAQAQTSTPVAAASEEAAPSQDQAEASAA